MTTCRLPPLTRFREQVWLERADTLTRAPMPPMAALRSKSRAQSPIGNLMRWVDEQAGRRVFPGDVLIHRTDLTKLRNEHRRWLRAVHGLHGERLEAMLNFHDIGGAPIVARWLVDPGELLIRWSPR